MKRSGLYLCGLIIVEFSIIVYLLAHTNGREVPFHNPLLLEAYPCRNTKDIIVWFEPGLSSKESYRYYVYINKVVPAHSVVNVTFDHKVNVTFTVQSDERKFSRISLTGGDLFTVHFFTQQEGLGVIVQALTPGITPNLISFTINDVEFCDNPDEGTLHKNDKTGNSSQEKEQIWEAESHRLMKADLRNCGRRNVDTELVVDGEAKPGAWPWYAAIYDNSTRNSKYYCGGTLISKNVVLTAGHCTVDRKAEDLYVVLNPQNFSQEFTGRRVVEIMVPESYVMYLIVDDIALLKLEKELNGIAHPACLWRDELGPVENYNGTIIGWGYDENDKLLANLQQANMPVVSNATCVAGHPDFARILNGNNFCAGYSERGTAVCKGDGGIGFLLMAIFVFAASGDPHSRVKELFKRRKILDRRRRYFAVFKPDDQSPGKSGKLAGTWHIKGVLSFSARDSADSRCVESFAVFTEAYKFRNWILGNLED